ncbi:alpha/beta fold hydrolase [Ahrensia sp. 13_GOM-1096m]|uniref:alpha/beta fold hydrolase n=1 Tax=Ahrensia sp. 13_GOM-1096m TaxID=1380380 RepID=UPI00047B1CFE|nr:alpha/beta hydrolase [Ahrensia sp. 13_GOM-1096m]
MNIIYALAFFLAALLFLLAGITRLGVWQIERANPPIGRFKTVNNTKLHYIHIKNDSDADLPPIVFLHGASGNLRDQMSIYGEALKGRAEMLFIDRPGHGYSKRGPSTNDRPDGQAATIAALLDSLGIEKAIIAGHSFGSIVTLSFALNHPDKTIGTLLMSPVSHPWPGGVSWYYNLTAMPIIGHIFSETLALPAGRRQLAGGTACVFAPNEPTPDYTNKTAVRLVLRPYHFRNNAADVASLYDYVSEVSPRYKEIKTPSIIVTGNRDAIVLPEIHSRGLDADIENSTLVWIKNVGHKSDYIASDIMVAALENLAGASNDLFAMRDALEVKVANDAFGPVENCLDNEEFRDKVRMELEQKTVTDS